MWVKSIVMYCARRSAREYDDDGSDGECTRSETTTTIGFRTRIGIGAAGHSHKGTADIERIGPPPPSSAAAAATGWLAGWSFGRPVTPPLPLPPPSQPPRVTVELCGLYRPADTDRPVTPSRCHSWYPVRATSERTITVSSTFPVIVSVLFILFLSRLYVFHRYASRYTRASAFNFGFSKYRTNYYHQYLLALWTAYVDIIIIDRWKNICNNWVLEFNQHPRNGWTIFNVL